MTRFYFDPAVYDLGVRGVYFIIRGMTNRSGSDADIAGFVASQLTAVPPGFENTPIFDGYAALHAKVAHRPKKLKAAPQVLLQYFRKTGDIPRINGIVDVYNAISLASGLALGAHDLTYVTGNIRLSLTAGTESFHPIGGEPTTIPTGEYAYSDAANDILCRLEVRQVEKTKITPESQNIFFIVQGHNGIAPTHITATAERLADQCRRFFGGTTEQLYP